MYSSIIYIHYIQISMICSFVQFSNYAKIISKCRSTYVLTQVFVNTIHQALQMLHRNYFIMKCHDTILNSFVLRCTTHYMQYTIDANVNLFNILNHFKMEIPISFLELDTSCPPLFQQESVVMMQNWKNKQKKSYESSCNYIYFQSRFHFQSGSSKQKYRKLGTTILRRELVWYYIKICHQNHKLWIVS